MERFIILTGDPSVGFTTVGPYPTNDAAADDGDYARIEYGGSDWWVFSLKDRGTPNNSRGSGSDVSTMPVRHGRDELTST